MQRGQTISGYLRQVLLSTSLLTSYKGLVGYSACKGKMHYTGAAWNKARNLFLHGSAGLTVKVA